jgi:putative membrane protein
LPITSYPVCLAQSGLALLPKHGAKHRAPPPEHASVGLADAWSGSGDRNMIWIANILVALVAALHVYFLVLEMFLWTKPLGLKTFRNSPEKAAGSAVLAANQGLYNGFLAAGLIWGLVQGNPGFAFQIKMFFLLCVIIAGIYGAATVSRRILYVQAAPAAVALILLWLA